MNTRKMILEKEVIMLDVDGLCTYISMGKTKATEFGERVGAKIKMGKRTLYDKRIIDKALDEMVN